MEPVSAVARVVAEITADIEAGRLRAGDPLPSEPQIMGRYEVSRGTARAAVAKLRGLGLVVTHAGRGSFVRARSERETLLPGDVVTVDGPCSVARGGEVLTFAAGTVFEVGR